MQARERQLDISGWVSRSGATPEPTVKVRMEENNLMLPAALRRVCLRLNALIHVKRRNDMNQTPHNTKVKIALIQASWHFQIVDKARLGLLDELTQNGWPAGAVEIFQVPGAFDIPLLAKRLAQTGSYQAIVASGFVVDGGIYRHDFVASTVIDALMQVQLETGVPVISAVLTPHQFQETAQHIAFFEDHFVTKGKEAAQAVMMITGTFAELQAA